MNDLYDINDWLNIHEHQKLGEILMRSGKINLVHLGMALDIQRFQDLQLGEILLNMKIVSKEDMEQALVLQRKLILMNKKKKSKKTIEQSLTDNGMDLEIDDKGEKNDF